MHASVRTTAFIVKHVLLYVRQYSQKFDAELLSLQGLRPTLPGMLYSAAVGIFIVVRRGSLALKRSLFYGTVALCLATAALWVRGYFASDCIQWFINSRGGGTVRQTTITTRLFPGAVSIELAHIE